MDMHQARINAAKEALEEIDLAGVLDDDAIENIVCWIEGVDENSGLMQGPIPSYTDTRIEDLKREHAKEIERFEEIEQCYRRSVARRRGVHVSDVRLDEYGNVTYRPM